MNISTLKRYRLPFKQDYWDILALSAWGILFLHYWLSDRLKLLIHPRFFWAVVLAGFTLLTLAVVRAIAIYQSRLAPTPQHIAILPKGLGSALMLAVAVLGMAIPVQPLGSQAVLQEGYAFTELPPTRSQAKQFTGGVQPKNRTLSDWARTLAVYPEPDSYIGESVNAIGFVVHPPNLPEDIFMITRFVIRHCAIDAVPVGLPVLLDQPRSVYPQDSWLAVEGKMTTLELDGIRKVAIAPTSISSIPQPDDPYEY